jgi:hypothetical protein
MAIQVNTTVQTSDGFEVQPFCFLDIQLYQPFSRAILSYYKSKEAFVSGSSSLNVNLPSLAEVPLTSEEFFGPNLATIIHEKAIEAIETTTGPGTCVIVENI